MTASPATQDKPRVEDDALVRGLGSFTDDPKLPNQVYGAFVRSPHAHAKVLKVDSTAALKAKGVLAVLTAADIKAAGIGGISRHPPAAGRGGAKMAMPFRPVLAETPMHAGDPVALVVAETPALALDAADLVQVDYEELTPVVDLDAAMKAETQLYPDVPGNLCVDWRVPSRARTTSASRQDHQGSAARRRVRVVHQRMVVASMETRGATGEYDKANESYTLHACSPGADAMRGQAASIMGVPNEKLRVLTADVGGAFGMKRRATRNTSRCWWRRAKSDVRCVAIDAIGSLRQRRASPRRRRKRNSLDDKGNSWRCACACVQSGRCRGECRHQHQHQ